MHIIGYYSYIQRRSSPLTVRLSAYNSPVQTRPPLGGRTRGSGEIMGFQLPNIDVLPRHPLIIGDRREEAGSGQTLPHVYPGTGTVTREIKMASPADVDRAVDAARSAFPAWRAMPGDKRRDLMFKL